MKALNLFIILLLSFKASAETALNFEQAVKAIIERDTAIAAQKIQIDAAESGRLAGHLRFLPALEAGVNRTRTYQNIGEVDDRYVRATLNLFRGGTDIFNLNASRYSLRFQNQQMKSTQLKTEAEAVEAIASFIEKQRALEIAKGQAKLWERSVEVARSQFGRGLSARQEVEKAQVDLNNANARVQIAQIELESATAFLNQLLGHTQVMADWPWIAKLTSLNLDTVDATAFELEQRPELLAYKLRMIEEENRVRAEYGSFLPKVDVSYTWSENDVYNIFDKERTVLLSMSMPFFSGWSDVFALRQRKASLGYAWANWEETRRQTDSQWVAKRNQLKQGLITAKARESTLGLSRSLYKDNFNRFENGRASVNELQLDQSRLLDSENLANQGWQQAHLLYMQFCHYQGKSIFNCD